MSTVDGQYVYTYDGVCNSDWMTSWPSLNLTWVYVVNGALSDDSYDLTVPPYSYLIGKNDNTVCNCLISSAVTTTAGLLGAGSSSGINLGGPFFRNFAIDLDYVSSGINLKSKTVESPYNPVWEAEKAANSSIGLWEIMGFVAGGIVFLILVVICGYCFYKKSVGGSEAAPPPSRSGSRTASASGPTGDFKPVEEAPLISTNI